MNELYFSVKGSTWKAEKPTAYYMDDICEFLSVDNSFEDRENFQNNFLEPLNSLYRKKYETITGSGLAYCEEKFEIEIPKKIFESAVHAFKYYLDQYPGGKYQETVRDFLDTAEKACQLNSSIIIIGA